MKRLKELWKTSAVLQTLTVPPLIIFVGALTLALLNWGFRGGRYPNDLSEIGGIIVIDIAGLSLLWIWRRPVWRTVKRVWGLVGWLDKKAKED